ncbi:MAG: hypothetical protein MK066_13685 [Crocinitomicaceae bacterium]|nr:hypothetical protein [Crocinitomicaceae bacterium]
MSKPITRVTDIYINPTMQGASAPIACPGSSSLFVGNLPIVQLSDTLTPIPDTAIPTSMTVLHGNIPVNVLGDTTSQGGSLLLGDTTVLIG